MEQEGGEPLELAKREGLLRVRDDSALVGWIDEVFAENPRRPRVSWAAKRSCRALVGLVMKKSRGSADPKKVNQLLGARVG